MDKKIHQSLFWINWSPDKVDKGKMQINILDSVIACNLGTDQEGENLY